MAAAFRRQAKLLDAPPQIGVAASRSAMPVPAATSRQPVAWNPPPANKKVTETIHIARSPRVGSVGSNWWKYVLLILCFVVIAAALAVVLRYQRTPIEDSAQPAQPQRPKTRAVHRPEASHPAKSQSAPKESGAEPAQSGRSEISSSAIAPSIGEILISSAPSGAMVEIEGRPDQSGNTPMDVGSLSPGVYKVTLRKNGYAPEARQVEVAAGKRASLDVKLNPTQGFLTVAGVPDGGHVFVNGADTGKVTPAELTLDPAVDHIVVRKEGFLDAQTDVTIVAGQSANFAPTLQAAGRTDNIKAVGGLSKFLAEGPAQGAGQIEIKTQPKGAQIIINGIPFAKPTPVVIQVQAGNYDITLQKEGYQPVEKTVTVKSEQKLKIEEALKR